jgi:hypothetical protein
MGPLLLWLQVDSQVGFVIRYDLHTVNQHANDIILSRILSLCSQISSATTSMMSLLSSSSNVRQHTLSLF